MLRTLHTNPSRSTRDKRFPEKPSSATIIIQPSLKQLLSLWIDGHGHGFS